MESWGGSWWQSLLVFILIKCLKNLKCLEFLSMWKCPLEIWESINARWPHWMFNAPKANKINKGKKIIWRAYPRTQYTSTLFCLFILGGLFCLFILGGLFWTAILHVQNANVQCVAHYLLKNHLCRLQNHGIGYIGAIITWIIRSHWMSWKGQA